MRFAAKGWNVPRGHWLAAIIIALLPALALAQSSPSDLLQQLSPDQLQQLGQSRQGTNGGDFDPNGRNNGVTVLHPAQSQTANQPVSRLEDIMSRRAGVKLRQFGYSQFGVGQTVTVPQAGAVQSSYVLGAGDDIVVSLRGQVNAEYRVQVNRDGAVVLPKMPPVSAAGRTLGDFRADLVGAVHRAYVATDAFVSVAQLRQVSVLVVGEVDNPGRRIVTGLSTPIDAILLSGGVNKTGSLRNVKLIRDGKTITIDLYALLTQQGTARSFALAEGDRILVPALGPTVSVTGWVRRPGIYEMAPGQSKMTVRQLLALAGGTEVRDAYRLAILRVAPGGASTMVPATENSPVGDSDILYIQPAADQSLAKATLSGGSALAGRFPITSATTLSQILKAPGALGESPYALIGVISRRDPRTYARTLVAFSPVAVLSSRSDLALQTDDVVRVFSTDEFEMVRKVIGDFADYEQRVAEAARNPEAVVGAEFDFNHPDRANPAPAQPSASTAAQNVTAASNYLANNSNQAAQRLSAQLQSGGPPQGQAGQDGSIAQVPSQQGNNSAAPQLSDVQSYDQQRGAGGLADQDSRNGQAKATTFTDLAQQLSVQPLILANFLTDRIVHLSGAVRGPGEYLVGPEVSLADLVAAAGGARHWADGSGVELTTTEVDTETGKAVTKRVTLPLGKGMLAQYIVQPRDELRFREVYTTVDAGEVTLQGQVHYPGKYQISSGEHLSDLLVRGGGLTNIAYPYGTVFLRRSAAAIERAGYQRVADEIQNQLLIGLTRSNSSNSTSLNAESFGALQSFVKEVREATPLGRISIIADPSRLLANPSLDVLLEPGDVVYIPQRPSTVTVLGRVLQPGSFPFRPGRSMDDYIGLAGGYAQFADESDTFIVLPDGSARRYQKSWLNFDQPDIPPGSSVVVPRDLTPLDLRELLVNSTQLLGSLATTAASLAVLSKQ